MRAILWFLLIFLLNAAQAQWLVNISVNQAYDNNPFRTPEAFESWISTANLGLQYNFTPFSASYIGGFTRFDQIMERNYYFHQLAIFGNSGATNWGVYTDQRFNGEEFEIYNYTTYTAFLNHRFRVGDFNTFIDGHVYVNKYAQLREINNLELSNEIRLNKSFPSRTTFIFGSTFIYKRYLTATGTITEVSDDGMGQGHGSGIGSGSYLVYSEVEAPSASQVIILTRIAQSISEKTGIAGQYQKRVMISGTSRSISGLYDGYNAESQIFDDPIGYESDVVGGEYTQLFPAGFYLKGAFYYSQKRYTSQGIYSSFDIFDESTLREDIYRTAWVRLQKTFPLNFPVRGSVILRLIYQWTKNSSNSYWYDHKNQYAGLDFEFQF